MNMNIVLTAAVLYLLGGSMSIAGIANASHIAKDEETRAKEDQEQIEFLRNYNLRKGVRR